MSNRSLTALAIAPNAIYVSGLLAVMLWRLASGLQPLPNGATAAVVGLSVIVPIASVALANVLRLRRDAQGPSRREAPCRRD
jgi:hypothetical protein